MSADVDVSQAMLAKWATSALPASVPGGIAADDLVKPDTRPWARILCKQGPKRNEYTSGKEYIDYRDVTIEIYGVGKAAIGAIVDLAAALFDDQPLTIPGVPVLRVEPLGHVIDKEQKKRQGDDFRAARMRWCVWTQRRQA